MLRVVVVSLNRFQVGLRINLRSSLRGHRSAQIVLAADRLRLEVCVFGWGFARCDKYRIVRVHAVVWVFCCLELRVVVLSVDKFRAIGWWRGCGLIYLIIVLCSQQC